MSELVPRSKEVAAIIAGALQQMEVMKSALELMQKENEEMRPKVEKYDLLEEQNETISLAEAAKRIQSIYGIRMSNVKLYELLRRYGYVFKNKNEVIQEHEGLHLVTSFWSTILATGKAIKTPTVRVRIPGGFDWLLKMVVKWLSIKSVVAEIECNH